MPERPDAVMLFAAGFGTRMRPLTDAAPKPLIEVAGRPLLDHALDLVRAAGLTRIVANTHYLSDQMRDALAERDVAAVHEAKILDTGGGLRNALPVLGEGPVMTLNTDSVWTGPSPVERLLQAWAPDEMDALLMLVPRTAAAGHIGAGDFDLLRDGGLQRGTEMIYTGLQILKTGVLHRFPQAVFSLNAVWDEVARTGRLCGVTHPGGWCDVGRPEAIALAEKLLEAENV